MGIDIEPVNLVPSAEREVTESLKKAGVAFVDGSKEFQYLKSNKDITESLRLVANCFSDLATAIEKQSKRTEDYWSDVAECVASAYKPISQKQTNRKSGSN